MPTSTRQWVLNTHPTGLPTLTGPSPTFKLSTTPLQPITSSQALIKTLIFSNDPAQRLWISALSPGQSLTSLALGEVLESGSPSELPVGSTVFIKTVWTEYSIVEIKDARVVEPIEGLSLGHFVGVLGLPGLTAYYGLIEKVKTGKDDTVLVSGAAGAVGSVVVQLAKKVLGAKRVIGISGSDEKARWVESLGADVCINYKAESFEQDFLRETEGGIDVFFDNVGGPLLDSVLLRINTHGLIAVCGAIDNYNKAEPYGTKNLFKVITSGITIYGLSLPHYAHKASEVTEFLVKAWKEGKFTLDDSLQTLVDVPFEDVPAVWLRLFAGGNTGKLVTRLVE
ncbi:hypothetical protein BJX70DRAFT_357115 [Aspergillus crustosus]